MSQELAQFVSDERGMTTAEYAVGTVAAVGFGGLLIKLLTSPEVQQLLFTIIQHALTWALQ